MSVRVIRGREAALLAHLTKPEGVAGRPLFFCRPPSRGERGWRSLGALRVALGQLRQELSAERFDEILARHAPAAALLLPGRRARLTAAEEALVAALAARPTSHMTHNFLLQHPIFEAWAELLVDLTAGGGFTLVVPCQTLLGWEDSALLKAVYRRFADRAPDLLLGFDPTFRHAADEDGIVWSMSSHRSLAVALDLAALQDGEPVDLPGGVASEMADEELAVRLLALPDDPDDLEAQALQALAAAAASGRPFAGDERRADVAAVRACAASFAFTSVLRLGLALLARRPELSSEEAADVHAAVALAAHNRQFLGEDNRALAAFLARHLEAALAVESRPERRSALLYRLAVVRGRRQKDFAAALAVADEAVAASHDALLSPHEAAYQEAWAHNIRAYVLMRLGRLAEAETATVEGFERLDGVVEEAALNPMWRIDLRATHSLLAFNTRSLLETLGRSDDRLAVWLDRSRRALAGVPAIVRFEAFHWTELYERMLRPDLALPMALRGLDDARREVDALREYEHATNALEYCDRLGETAKARELCAFLQAFRARCGLPPLPAVAVRWALACQREGLWSEARERFAAALSERAFAGDEARAELLARVALLEAEAGDLEAAERALDKATELAIASGDRDALLRVALATGRCRELEGKDEEAKSAYEQALEIVESDEDGPPPAAADLIATLVGLPQTGDAGAVERALTVAAEALDDADAWWELPRLLAVLLRRPPDAEKNATAWRRVLTAARQRRDCAAFFPAICEAAGVPESELPPAYR